MSDKIVRIGGAGGFLGDSSVAAPQLISGGRLDYLILDYLAEATMPMLAMMQKGRPEGGYARDFTEWVWKDNIRELKRQSIKVVTNAGGLNPKACRARMEALATEAGLSFNIAIVEGDDLRGDLGRLADVREMVSGDGFPAADAVLNASVYFGADPIVAALRAGADVVITGRVVDSALVLAPLMYEFGWKASDYDQLAGGSLAGHVIECGAQATGGLFTDWESVPDWAHIGYPIVECAADGSFIVTKPEGTGGLVTCATVGEQILYEVGDPQAYMLPDVVCDFAGLKIEQVGDQRVRVSQTKGRAPSGFYKVSVTHADGWRCLAAMPVVGRDAARKAERQADAVIERVEEMLRNRNLPPFRAKRIEALGAEATYGANSRARDVREVVCKIGVEHDDPAAMEVFLREIDSPTTSMSPGSTGWFAGRPTVSPVIRVYSCLIDRTTLSPRVDLAGQSFEVAVIEPVRRFTPDQIERPDVSGLEINQSAAHDEEMVLVDLIDIAWARSGDKGDSFNVGVIARKPELLPYIRAALSQEAVLNFLAHEFEGGRKPSVVRFDLPGMTAINLLCQNALGGGQLATLRLDALAKGKAQQLLEFPVKVPARLV
jgi:hypothetical protein